MTTVIKKGGEKRQAFSPAKIKNAINAAAKEAGLSPAKRAELIKEVADPAIAFFKKKRLVKATEIRRSILRRLEVRSKATASKWKKFKKKKKK
jgi:transcriptional regulator NrdR family protein